MTLTSGVVVPDDDDECLVLTVCFVHAHDVADVEGNRQRRLAAEARRFGWEPAKLRRQTLEDTLPLPGDDFVAVLEPASNVAAALDDCKRPVTYFREQPPGL